MLFTPWRNENTDLMSHCFCFYERYLMLVNTVSDQMKECVVCNENLNEIQEKIDTIEDINNQYPGFSTNMQCFHFVKK